MAPDGISKKDDEELEARRREARWIARYAGDQRGPTFVAIGGMHGNEPSGIEAITRVATRLKKERPRGMRGTFIGLAGNLSALESKRRFEQRDLNRRWFKRDVEALQARDPAQDGPEDREQRDLLGIFDKLVAGSLGPLRVLDLHSTSSHSAPFVCMSDTLRNQDLAFALRVPVILGLEEAIEGTLMGYLSDRGHVAVAFEGGHHTDPDTVECAVAALWVSMVSNGMLEPSEVPDWDKHVRRLDDAARDLPRAVEILYRHAITPSDAFEMEPGYTSFQRIRGGQRVARDRTGPIDSPRSGRMLMPLYQGQGEDGFFIARDLGNTRLSLSVALRRLRVDQALPVLPGVERSRTSGGGRALKVDKRLGATPVREVLRLLGYRRVRPDGEDLVFIRRRQKPGR